MALPDTFESPVLCVDIGGTSTKAGMLNKHGEVQFLSSIPTKPDIHTYIEGLSNLIAQTISSAEAHGQKTREIGVAVAGFLDGGRGHLLYNSNLSWLEGFPLRQTLTSRFPSLAIELEVDSNAATMAEYRFGSGQNSKRFLCLASGTGLGAGMTIDGVPLRFTYGCMGDIGHVMVLRDGPLCTCGGRGCAEIMVSAPVVAERYRKNARIDRELSLRDVVVAAEAGDMHAIAVLRDAGEWLGIATASMANILFPDHIAIAGGLSAAGDFTLKPAEQTFRAHACTPARLHTTFTRAKLGSMATLIGAAWPFWESRTLRKDG